MRDELNAHRRPAVPGHPDTLTPFELKQSALGGLVWLSVGNGVRAVVKLGVLAVLARLLTPDDFGLLAAAGVVVWFALIFSNLGVGPALVQRRTLEPVHIDTAFASSVAFGIAMCGVIFLAAPVVSHFFRMPELTAVVRAMSVLFPIAGLAAVAECLLQRGLRFDVIARVELASYVVGYGLVGIGMALMGFNVWSLVGAELAKGALKTALYLRAVPPPRRTRFHGATFRELLAFGTGYTAGGISQWLVSFADTFVVGRLLGTAALGVYSRAYELMLVPGQALGTLLDKILFPTLARVQGDLEHVRTGWRRSMALTAMAVLPVGTMTAVLAPEIVDTLLGAAWTDAVAPLQIFAIAMYLRIGAMIGYSVANSTGAVRQTAWRNAVQAALVFAGALIGQRWGLTGVASGVVAAMAVNFVLVLQLGVRITKLQWKVLGGVHLRAAGLSLLAGVEVLIVRELAAGPAAVTLACCIAAVAVTALVLVRFAPALLGPDGIWIVDTLYRSAPRPLRPLLRKTPAA